MKSLCILLAVVALAAAKAPKCDQDKCKLPNCGCYGGKPSLKDTEIPQIVMISSDDAITKLVFDDYLKPVYFGRKNPNGCQIGATFFVPHEWSDYSKVHELYAKGFEIGVNSITKLGESEYWKKADAKLLEKEFGGQKQILQKFAILKADNIRGERSPNLQMAGDNTFVALKNSNLTYDNSWLTRREQEVWPYTLDYLSEQDCLIAPCPVESQKGEWVQPINIWYDQYGSACATIAGCSIPDEEADIVEWFKTNFNLSYKDKLPFNLIINSVAFGNPKLLPAYKKFLDYLGTLKDVYIVNMWQAIEWFQKPKALGDKTLFSPCFTEEPHSDTNSKACKFVLDEKEERYMTIYGKTCPKNYPWLDNPTGK